MLRVALLVGVSSLAVAEDHLSDSVNGYSVSISGYQSLVDPYKVSGTNQNFDVTVTQPTASIDEMLARISEGRSDDVSFDTLPLLFCMQSPPLPPQQQTHSYIESLEIKIGEEVV